VILIKEHLIHLPVFELKGVSSGQGLSIDATTKMLRFPVNSNEFFINPTSLIRLNGNGTHRWAESL
jgi:hypothetical protein